MGFATGSWSKVFLLPASAAMEAFCALLKAMLAAGKVAMHLKARMYMTLSMTPASSKKYVALPRPQNVRARAMHFSNMLNAGGDQLGTGDDRQVSERDEHLAGTDVSTVLLRLGATAHEH